MFERRLRPGLGGGLRVGAWLGNDSRGFTISELLVTLAIMGLVMAALAGVQVTGSTMFQSGENQAQALEAARAAMMMEEDLKLVGYGYPAGLTAISGASTTSISFWADLNNVSTTLAAAVAAGGKTFTVASAAGISPGNTIYLINGSTYDPLSVKTVSGGTITVNTGPTNAYPSGALVGRPLPVVYSWAGNTLSKDPGDGTGAQPVVSGVGVTFGYFDTSDNAIAAGSLSASLANIRRINVSLTAQSTATQNPGSFAATTNVRPRNLP